MKSILFIFGISLLLFDKFHASPDGFLRDYNHDEAGYAAIPTSSTTRRRRGSRSTKGKVQHKDIGNIDDLSYDSETDEETTVPPSRTTRRPQMTTRKKKQEGKPSDSFDKYLDRSDDAWYNKFRDRHNLPEPYQLPGRKRILELENMPDCRCPRVYWPVCAQNNITYLNYCIMDCLDQDIRRYGPCIHYRRSGDNFSGFLSNK